MASSAPLNLNINFAALVLLINNDDKHFEVVAAMFSSVLTSNHIHRTAVRRAGLQVRVRSTTATDKRGNKKHNITARWTTFRVCISGIMLSIKASVTDGETDTVLALGEDVVRRLRIGFRPVHAGPGNFTIANEALISRRVLLALDPPDAESTITKLSKKEADEWIATRDVTVSEFETARKRARLETALGRAVERRRQYRATIADKQERLTAISGMAGHGYQAERRAIRSAIDAQRKQLQGCVEECTDLRERLSRL